MPEHVTICEVGPRDGLQNEAEFVSADDRVRLIDLLSACGLRYIEAASFVSPKWVPRMAGGHEVLSGIARRSGVVYAALTPNIRGYEEALLARANEVAVFASASENFSRKNINCTIAESLARYDIICGRARTDGMPVRGYVSCAIACPYEGPVAPNAVAKVAMSLLAMGCREVSLGDTIGVATVADTARLLDAVLSEIPADMIAGHFHDTHGRALDCISASLGRGIRVFDASVGGTGGCPFAPGAKGNIATDGVARMLQAQGYATGIDTDALDEATDFMLHLLGRKR